MRKRKAKLLVNEAPPTYEEAVEADDAILIKETWANNVKETDDKLELGENKNTLTDLEKAGRFMGKEELGDVGT